MFDKREFCTHAQLYQERNRTPRQYPPKIRCIHEASLELNCTRLPHPVQSPGVQSYLQSRTKLLEKVLPIMSTFLGNKTISKTTPLRKENPFPQFNVASYKRPGIRLSFEYTTTLLSGEGGERRTGTATMFRKMLSKYTIFSTVLSKIVDLDPDGLSVREQELAQCPFLPHQKHNSMDLNEAPAASRL